MAEPLVVARLQRVAFAGGSTMDVDLVRSDRPADEERTFAAMVFVRDAAGRFALVHSIRRDQWGSPGGWREPGESVVANAIREVAEETGIRLVEAQLRPVGYERYRPSDGGQAWRPGQDLLQCFAAELDSTESPLVDSMGDTSAQEWVGFAELQRRCGALFWWPLAEAVFSPHPEAGPPHG